MKNGDQKRITQHKIFVPHDTHQIFASQKLLLCCEPIRSTTSGRVSG